MRGLARARVPIDSARLSGVVCARSCASSGVASRPGRLLRAYLDELATGELLIGRSSSQIGPPSRVRPCVCVCVCVFFTRSMQKPCFSTARWERESSSPRPPLRSPGDSDKSERERRKVTWPFRLPPPFFSFILPAGMMSSANVFLGLCKQTVSRPSPGHFDKRRRRPGCWKFSVWPRIPAVFTCSRNAVPRDRWANVCVISRAMHENRGPRRTTRAMVQNAAKSRGQTMLSDYRGAASLGRFAHIFFLSLKINRVPCASLIADRS